VIRINVAKRKQMLIVHQMILEEVFSKVNRRHNSTIQKWHTRLKIFSRMRKLTNSMLEMK